MKRKIVSFVKTMLAFLVICLVAAHWVTGYSLKDVQNTLKVREDPDYTPVAEITEKVTEAIKDRKEAVTFTRSKWYEEHGVWENIRGIVQDIVSGNPDYYWVEIAYQMDGSWNDTMDDVSRITVLFSYLGEQEREKRQLEIDQAADEFLSSIPADADSWDKVRLLHDKLITEITYEENENGGTVYGALVSKRCVCMGYCMAFEYLLNKLDISCDTIIGYTTPGAKEFNSSSLFGSMNSHAWNQVTIVEDGQEKTFYVDVTWDNTDTLDAQGNEYVRHKWFGVSDEEMEQVGRCKEVVLDGEEEEIVEAGDCNYYVRRGSVMQGYDPEQIRAAFERQLEDGYHSLTLKWNTREEKMQARERLVENQEIYSIFQQLGLDVQQYSYDNEDNLLEKYYTLDFYL